MLIDEHVWVQRVFLELGLESSKRTSLVGRHAALLIYKVDPVELKERHRARRKTKINGYLNKQLGSGQSNIQTVIEKKTLSMLIGSEKNSRLQLVY